MPFIIKNDSQYLVYNETGCFLSSNKNKATVWKREDKAMNVLRGLNKRKDIRWHNFSIQNIGEPSDSSDVKTLISNALSSGDIQKCSSGLQARLTELNKEISLCDQAINDLEHAAEFLDLNACEGYKLYKKLKEYRIKKRSCKEESSRINSILSSNSKSLIQNVYNIEETHSKRTYTPRVITEFCGKKLDGRFKIS